MKSDDFQAACPKPGLWAFGRMGLNSPPLVSTLVAMLDRHAGEGEYLEVGTRAGGSTMLRMAHAGEGGVLVTVDPYGDMPYMGTAGLYGNDVEDAALSGLSTASVRYGFRWQHWRMLSVDFLERVAPLGYWLYGKHHAYRWRGVFLDGDHTWENVCREIALAAPNLVERGSIVIDNADHGQEGKIAHPFRIEEAARLVGLDCQFFDAGEGNIIAVLHRGDAASILGLPRVVPVLPEPA